MVERELPPLDAPDVQQIRGKLDTGMIEKNLPIHIYDDKTQYGTRLPYAHLKAMKVLPEQKDLVEEYMTKRRTDYLTQGGKPRGLYSPYRFRNGRRDRRDVSDGTIRG